MMYVINPYLVLNCYLPLGIVFDISNRQVSDVDMFMDIFSCCNGKLLIRD